MKGISLIKQLKRSLLPLPLLKARNLSDINLNHSSAENIHFSFTIFSIKLHVKLAGAKQAWSVQADLLAMLGELSPTA